MIGERSALADQGGRKRTNDPADVKRSSLVGPSAIAINDWKNASSAPQIHGKRSCRVNFWCCRSNRFVSARADVQGES